MKTAFLIIDAQYDFCNPAGTLYIPGADADMQRLSKLIYTYTDKIDGIYATLDTHPVNDISHPSFWEDANGKAPNPFTLITSADLKAGNWRPCQDEAQVSQYIEQLDKQGEFVHCIWPEHCLHGSKGAALDDTLLEALRHYAHHNKEYQTLQKGTHPLTEHFGIFQAQIPIVNAPETQLNTAFITELLKYDQIFLCGEAKSHCVATSLKQAMTHAPTLAQKFILIADIMTDVPTLGHLGEPIYAEAQQRGIRFIQSADIQL